MTKRNIKIGNKTINYNYEGSLNAKETVAIESCIKGAQNQIKEALYRIERISVNVRK